MGGKGVDEILYSGLLLISYLTDSPLRTGLLVQFIPSNVVTQPERCESVVLFLRAKAKRPTAAGVVTDVATQRKVRLSLGDSPQRSLSESRWKIHSEKAPPHPRTPINRRRSPRNSVVEYHGSPQRQEYARQRHGEPKGYLPFRLVAAGAPLPNMSRGVATSCHRVFVSKVNLGQSGVGSGCLFKLLEIQW